ncbi:hypothetical protein WJX79_010257 [Trebouxia sp. C0005]
MKANRNRPLGAKNTLTVAAHPKERFNMEPVCSNAHPIIHQPSTDLSSSGPSWGSYLPVSISGVTDPADQHVVIAISKIEQNEPTYNQRSNDSCPDAQVNGLNSLFVRSESSEGPEDEATSVPRGRTYFIHFTARNEAGLSCDGTPYYSGILMLLCAMALAATKAAGVYGLPEIELQYQTRTLQQALAPAPSPSSVLTLQAGPGDVQIAGAVELQVTCPFVVPFNQASQVLITDSLQAVLPPNTTIGQVNMMQQLSNDTVIVSTQFSIWESQLPILLANKCCALEDLYLQYAVERISPSTTGQNVSMTLINWTIGNTSMKQAPAAAPGQSVIIDTSTLFFLGGVTATSTPQQAMANFTVVDVPVRTIATKNNTLAATVQLAIAHRYAVKTLMWSLGVQVEVLNMTDSSNKSMVPSVDFLNRLWVPNEAPTPAAFVQTMLLTATAAPAQYVALMNQSGFSVDVDVMNTSVIGTVANASLPSIEVVPPSNGFKSHGVHC